VRSFPQGVDQQNRSKKVNPGFRPLRHELPRGWWLARALPPREVGPACRRSTGPGARGLSGAGQDTNRDLRAGGAHEGSPEARQRR
jgi:hypothetical protein